MANLNGIEGTLQIREVTERGAKEGHRLASRRASPVERY